MLRTTAPLNLHDHGALRTHGAVSGDLGSLRAALADLPIDKAGVRLNGIEDLNPFLAPRGSIGAIARKALGPSSRPVRAILFDKNADTNWSLGWHQDRTISVKKRVSIEGFGPWTTKQGMQHVAPPFELLSRMVTLRVHLDDVPYTNAPLLIAPSSHKHGRVPIDAIDDVVRRCGSFTCLADAGDVWIYATSILHASSSAAVPARRRVLQVDYSADDLPGELEWLGV